MAASIPFWQAGGGWRFSIPRAGAAIIYRISYENDDRIYNILRPLFILYFPVFFDRIPMKPAWLLGFFHAEEIFGQCIIFVECSKLRVLPFPPLLSKTERGITRNPDI
jgi:hypothetical protein